MENECLFKHSRKFSVWDYLPARYFLTGMLFSGLFIIFALRVSVSIAMVAMVNATSNGVSHQCPDINAGRNITFVFETAGEFDWSPYWQGIILASFYYGYIVTQVPGGLLAERYGSKWVFGCGVLTTSMLSILTPFAARRGIGALIVLRVIEGIGEGITYPAMFIMFVYWSTLKERSMLLAIACTGANIGSIVATPVAAFLCECGFDGGWPSVFYVFGLVGCIWFVLWALLVFNKPADHPWISKVEKLHLEEDSKRNIIQSNLPVPWKAIFSSLPFWALLYTRFANFWILFTITSELPSYLSSVLRLTIMQNGAASAVIYSCLSFGMALSGYLSDILRRREYFTLTTIRKGFECIGLFGSAIFLVILPAARCSITVVITLLSIGLFLYGFNCGGSNPTIVDMAPAFAGTITGLVATLPSTAGFLGPMLTGMLTKDGQTIEEWDTVFYVIAGVLISGGLCFLAWGSAEIQPWALVRKPVLQTANSVTEDESLQQPCGDNPSFISINGK